MIRVKGRYRGQKLELDQALDLAEGTEVEIEVRPVDEAAAAREAQDWQSMAMSRLEEEWDNPQDAIYDRWRELYND